MKKEKNKPMKGLFTGCFAFILLILAGFFLAGCHNSIMEEWWYDKGGQNPPSSDSSKPDNSGGGGGGSGVNFGVVRFVLGFDPDDSKGEGPQPLEINVLWGDVVGRLRPISRDDYGFDGWFDEENQPWDVETRKVEKNDTDNFAKADIDRDGYITLKAKWNQYVCTVSFETGEYANDIPDQTVAYGGKAVDPVMPTPTDGKGFAGWYNNSGYSGNTWNFSTDTVTSNITLYAKWEDNACLVNFIANGGTRPDGVTQLTHTQSVAWGHPAQDPGPLVKFDASKKPSHSFAGWFDNPGFSGAPWDFTNPVPPQPSLTLHAKWEINQYTITFETPDTVPAIPDQAIDHGSLITDPYDPVPDLPPGYGDFDGWYTKDGTDGNWGDKWDFDNNEVTDNVKLHPRWKHSVIFVPYVVPSNVIAPPDGAVTIPPLSVEHGAIITQPGDPVKPEDGRDFSGWWTKDGTGNDWGVQWNFSTKVTENLTLYGKFTHKNRTVVFMVNGGDEMPKPHYSAPIGGQITNPGNPMRQGYIFLGWYLNPDFTPGSKVNLTTYKVPAPDIVEGMDNLYLYANWSISTVYICFNVVDDNGVVIFNENQIYNYGDRILMRPTVPAELNHQLVGWYFENGAKNGGDTWHLITRWDFDTDIVTESHDLFARQVAADHTVTFTYGAFSGSAPGNFPDAADLTQYVVNNGYADEPFMPPSTPGSANFVAWYDGAAPFDFSTPITGNKTLTAKWVDDVPGMVWVPRGSFIYGDSNVSGKTADYNAYPSEVITLNGFFISETEITQQQFTTATGVNPSKFTGANRPVENVTWAEANAYAAGSGSRLPNETEWEYAAKGGHYGLLTDNTYSIYSGSNNPTDVAWYNETVKPQPEMGTQPVKGKTANSLGIYDMSGNVAEWCANSLTPSGGSAERVIRGGSWSSAAGNVRNVIRNSQAPARAGWNVGFRVVRDPSTIY